MKRVMLSLLAVTILCLGALPIIGEGRNQGAEVNGDLNCSDGGDPIDIADLVYMVDYMFNAGPAPCAFAGGVPQGAIVMWSGSLASIPTGWALCDGSNGTPDLRDRFVYGCSAGQEPGPTGGAASHSHTVSAHAHSVRIWSEYYWTAIGWSQFGSQNTNVANPPSGGHTGVDIFNDSEWGQNTLYELSSPGATREKYEDRMGTKGNTGNASPGTSTTSSLPPYYKLAFIMKL